VFVHGVTGDSVNTHRRRVRSDAASLAVTLRRAALRREPVPHLVHVHALVLDEPPRRGDVVGRRRGEDGGRAQGHRGLGSAETHRLDKGGTKASVLKNASWLSFSHEPNARKKSSLFFQRRFNRGPGDSAKSTVCDPEKSAGVSLSICASL
jgi:hypothetical protein